MAARRACLGVALLASAALGQTPAFRATVQEVLVPVSVLNKSGKPVLGLTRDDFQLFFDGRPAAIGSFRAVNAAPPAASSAATRRVPALPPNVFVNVPALAGTRQTRVVLLLDYLNTTTSERQRIRMQLVRFLRQRRQGETAVAIYGMTDSLLLLQPFTSDPSVLARAAAEILAAKPGRGAPGLPPPAVVGTAALEPLAPAELAQAGITVAAGPPVGTTDGAIEYFVARERWVEANLNRLLRARYVLAQFEQLARSLSGIPGRKEVLWLTSDASPLNPSLMYQQVLEDPAAESLRVQAADVGAAYRALAAADVSVFPVDVRGVSNPGLLGAGSQASHASFEVMMGHSSPGEDATSGFADHAESLAADSSLAMTGAAVSTGGEVLANNNDLVALLLRAESLWSSYYLLSAVAPPAAPGYHKIEVKVARKGVKLLFRRGFATESAAQAAASKARESDLQQAAHVLMDATGVEIVLYLGMPRRVGQGAELPFTATIWGPSLNSEKTPRGQRYFFTAATVTIAAAGKVVASAGQDFDRVLAPAAAAQVAARGYTFPGKFVIPGSGEYYGRLIVRDDFSGRLGTITLRLR